MIGFVGLRDIQGAIIDETKHFTHIVLHLETSSVSGQYLGSVARNDCIRTVHFVHRSHKMIYQTSYCGRTTGGGANIAG